MQADPFCSFLTLAKCPMAFLAAMATAFFSALIIGVGSNHGVWLYNAEKVSIGGHRHVNCVQLLEYGGGTYGGLAVVSVPIVFLPQALSQLVAGLML